MPPDSLPRDLVAWRAAQLRAAGFDAGTASALGGDCGYDVHALIELVERGCAPSLAARILAPIDERPRPC
jgi:hypothetical protein